MATGLKKKKPYAKTLLYGAATAILYAAVFSHSDAILQLFTRGGIYAALPIATVFVFSFAHGTFAHNLWSLLGIEAVTKRPAQRPTVPAPRPAQRPRARLRLSL
jgi:hypothetical protein